jgi:protein-tyrosine-phosphatase
VTDTSTSDTFEVAFVCTGNRARSALSEALYRRYARGFDTSARSFGTLDVAGASALEQAVDAGARLGVDLRAHTAVTLARGVLAEADLVLGFEPHHVAAAVIDGEAPPGRVFLLREFVELTNRPPRGDGSPEHARSEVAAAHGRRAKLGNDAARFVIEDPAGRPSSVMYAAAAEMDELVRRTVRVLFGYPAHT